MGWAGMEVYTAPGMQAHFQLAFDYHSDVFIGNANCMRTIFASGRVSLHCKKVVNTKWKD